MNEIVHLGMDDIDNPRGGCTTHFASLIVERLDKAGVEWIDYPNLIRLNPNIPYRTRGNGAVALRFKTDIESVDEIYGTLEEMVSKYAESGYPNTNPGIIAVRGKVPPQLIQIGSMALWRVVPLALVKRIMENLDLTFIVSGNGRGLVGATAAVGNPSLSDYTYEYIAYRPSNETDKERGVVPQSVQHMDTLFEDSTFSNIDPENGSILIEPHGPDPVLFGIRGESPKAVIQAAELIESEQVVDRWLLFRTNQGTGAHLTHRLQIKHLRPYLAGRVLGRICSKPEIIEGGHVFVRLEDESGEVDCAAYEPTGGFRNIVMRLIQGDEVLIHAGVRPPSSSHGLTLNIEGMEVTKLVDDLQYSNPMCPVCGKRLKSAGRNKGFKCVHCGYRERHKEKTIREIPRDLKRGIFLPPPRAQRHLTRPLSRMNQLNSSPPSSLIRKWFNA